MRYSNITATFPIENWLVLKGNMEKSVSLKSTKDLTSNPNGKPPPGDKTLRLEPAIHFYEIEAGDKTE